MSTEPNWHQEKTDIEKGETSQRKALPPLPTKAESLQFKREEEKKNKGERKKKERSNPDYPIEVEL